MVKTKHCPTLRQPCPNRFECGVGCYAQPHNLHTKNSDGSDSGLPVVTFDKPWMWLRDLLFTAIYRLGVGSLILIAVLGVIAFVIGAYRHF